MRMSIFAPIDIDYFLIYFDYVLKATAKERSKGSAIKNIPPFEIFKKLLLPLPPLEEQKRIVHTLNKIFPYVDKYEARNVRRHLSSSVTKKYGESQSHVSYGSFNKTI